MGAVEVDLEPLLPLIKLLGGALQGASPVLAVQACLLYAYVGQTGEMLHPQKAEKMIGDLMMLIQIWDQEVVQ